MIEDYKQINKMNQDMLKKFVKMVDNIQNIDSNKKMKEADLMKLSEYLNIHPTQNKGKNNLQQDLFKDLGSAWEVKDIKEESEVDTQSINYDFSFKIEKNNRK